jgi:hypothetical protein
MKLLSYSNHKTLKGQQYGWLTSILNLAPANSSGVMNVCLFATALCKMFCIANTGHARVHKNVHRAQIRRTLWLHHDRVGFMDQLRKDIRSVIKHAKRLGLKPCVRLNGTSDLPWMAMQLCKEFREVMFYDYTANPKPWLRIRENYHITFSLKEDNLAAAMDAIAHQINVAVVFPNDAPMPATWNGIEVIDGDDSDLRFRDGYQGKVIGLKFKETKLRKEEIQASHQQAAGFIQIQPLGASA